ncbi:hypothetical protein [Alienimonas californiensis]|uniref:Yip1 domain protein n=1 Tax=Alienimonas californiensis TaxID=2527989 RepID=A0A517P3S4_9PLAN|nr:hypothetical protein [Alienimonas californiensis]QDT14021.1 hypothetical protein CA12_00890 [Alienimonas californiensis]
MPVSPHAALLSLPVVPLAWQRGAPDPTALLGVGIAFLLGAALAFAVSLLIQAVFLRLAASLVLKEEIPFGDALLTLFLSYVIAGAITFVIGLPVGFVAGLLDLPEGLGLAINLLGLPLTIGIQAAVIARRHDLSFGQALLIYLAMMVMGFLIGLVIALVVIGLLLAFGVALAP